MTGTIQVNSVASCGKQCRYGGLMCCRKSRVLLSAPLYNYFITFLMVCVFLLSVSFLLQTVTNNIVLAANLKVIETVIQAMLLVDSIHKILAIGWEPFTHDFWYVWRNLPQKKALCCVLPLVCGSFKTCSCILLLLTYFYLFYFLPLETFYPLLVQVRGGGTDQLFGGEFCIV